MKWFEKIAAGRAPDFTIGSPNNPYLRRWFLVPRNRLFNAYLHHFLKSDDARALHDHPWVSVSFLLKGVYVEHTIKAGGVHKKTMRRAPAIKFRFAKTAHRIEVNYGACWTLFITGPVIREWGFHCPGGWRRWKDFVSNTNAGETGRGCD